MVLGSTHQPDDERIRLRELGTQVEFRSEPGIHRRLMEQILDQALMARQVSRTLMSDGE